MYKENKIAILLDDPKHSNHRTFFTFKELETMLDVLGEALADRGENDVPAAHSVYQKLQEFSPFKNL